MPVGCLLSGLKRTSHEHNPMSATDPKRTLTRSAPSVPPPRVSSVIRALRSEFQRLRAIGTGISAERDPATWLHQTSSGKLELFPTPPA
jgi:hypothetical protein